ncbi:MAG: hypothetical protein AAB353_06120 [Candidatus Hydrogenedentota bacterium]
MTPGQAREYLDDYVDGDLDPAIARELEECANEHVELRAEIDALRGILSMASQMPEDIQPDRDLWPGIAERISGNVVEYRPRRRFGTSGFLRIAATVAVFAGLGFGVYSIRGTNVDAPVGSSPDVAISEMPQSERDYLAAKDGLLVELRGAEDRLSPEVVAALEENLRVIEDAVSEIRVALNDNPDDVLLERLLVATWRSEIDLLQHAVAAGGY